MKYFILILSLVLVGAGCQHIDTTAKQPQEDNNQIIHTFQDGVYRLGSNSKLFWSGRTALEAHEGTLALSTGSITVKDGVIISGSFEIDMQSIQNTDITSPKDQSELENVLKSENFFDVDHYPAATFILTRHDRSFITGDLTIKDVTQSITFPAYYEMDPVNHDIYIDAVYEIDRTAFDITYRSSKFFENLGDLAISNAMPVEIDLHFEPVTNP